MTIQAVGRHSSSACRPMPARRAPLDVGSQLTLHAARGLAAARIGFGVFVLWLFLDRLLGLRLASGAGWLHGGSPTGGVVASDAQGWMDRIFMLGLLLAGVSLVLGIGLRLAAGSSVMLYLMSWSAFIPMAVHTQIDSRLVFDAVAISILAIADAGRTWGVGGAWTRSSLGAALPVLR
ncbi:MAG: hypothetical protein ABWX74_14560 [Aeromicrobium sp.]